MSRIRIAAIQMRIGGVNNVDALCHRLDLAMAAFPWIQMVVMSELAARGPGVHHAEPLPSEIENRFCALARRHGIWLVPGSLCESVGELVYNTAPVISPDGAVVARYRKMFPFAPYEKGITPGTEFVVFDVPQVGRFGVSICYDIWIPETTRTLAAMGAEVVLHPSLTPTIDRDIELALVRSSAAVNQCFIVDVNGLEAGGNGRSIVAGPDGEIVYQAGEGPQIIPLELDLERVRRSRAAGVLGLGQPLKSFRDRPVDFSVYDRNRAAEFPFLPALGPLEKPGRTTPDRKLDAAIAPIAPATDEAIAPSVPFPPLPQEPR
ncbi:MAG: carbon-nitrogen hydrolase family protein [Thermoanaerobaculia bacterium]